jgi:K+-sensing histidine kinase KdpD
MSADTLHQGPVSPGRLRIYLGYAPGVGTTCALLSEGHRRAERGADVVVASARTQVQAVCEGGPCTAPVQPRHRSGRLVSARRPLWAARHGQLARDQARRRRLPGPAG